MIYKYFIYHAQHTQSTAFILHLITSKTPLAGAGIIIEKRMAFDMPAKISIANNGAILFLHLFKMKRFPDKVEANKAQNKTKPENISNVLDEKITVMYRRAIDRIIVNIITRTL